jgi:autoinducer 2-degrading protein
MLIVLVQVKVKSSDVEAFKAATIRNAQESRKEPGIARFDLLQQQDDPTRFVLVETYRNADAPHYQVWRDTVESMMAEPRQSTKFGNIDPSDADY